MLFATSVENLVIAGNRDAVQGASELLATPRLDELIQHIKLRSPGALILTDLPPVLSTDEALVVAPRMDAMFLVVSEGITRRDSLAQGGRRAERLYGRRHHHESVERRDERGLLRLLGRRARARTRETR